LKGIKNLIKKNKNLKEYLSIMNSRNKKYGRKNENVII